MKDGWRERGELGSLAGLLFMRWVALSLGRPLARLSLYPAVAWYLVKARREQRYVRDFLRRVLPRPPRFRDVARTYWNFGAVTLDRVFMLAGRDDALDVGVHGAGPLLELQEQGRGAILVGAHLGSFEAMRALGLHRRALDIRVLQYVDQNPLLMRVFADVNPGLADAIIPLGTPDVMLRVGETVERGGFAAVLADRVGPGDPRSMPCRFLGGTARFATGALEAALVLGCPVLFFAGLYRGGKRYDLHFEVLSGGERPPRRDREREVRRLAGRYAECLERYARSAPYNWFNIYSYWED